MSKKAILTVLGVALIGTGCANVHEFINNPVLTSLAPSYTNAAKAIFYPDRYTVGDPTKITPVEFANTAGDYLGEYKFVGFTQNLQNPSQYMANYYLPTKGSGTNVPVSIAVFFRYPEFTQSKKEYNSARYNYEYDCVNQTTKLISGQAYSSKSLDGVMVSDTKVSKKDSQPTPIGPTGVDRTVYNKVCKK